jgi:capsid protein
LRELKNDRPSPNLQDFMDQSLRAAATGLGLPYEYLWKADLSGPSQRFVLAQAQRRFDEISQTIITQLVSRVRLWALAKGIKRKDLTVPNGMDRWWQAAYHTPKQTTIDAGRDSAADREDLKLGLTTYAEIYASRGDDWQEAIDQKIAEQSYIRAKCAEAGIPVSEIQFIQNQQPAATPPSEPPADAPAPTTETPAPQLAAVIQSETTQAPVLTEAFTMKDEPDFNFSDKELTMVAKSIGLKDKKPRKKKSS